MVVPDPDLVLRFRRAEDVSLRRTRAPLGVELLESRVLLSGIEAIRPVVTPLFVAGEVAPTSDVGAKVSLPEKVPVRSPMAIVERGAELSLQWTISAIEIKDAAGIHLGWETNTEPYQVPHSTHPVRELPDQPKTEIVGSVSTSDQVEFYHVPVHSNTHSVRVDARLPATAVSAILERLWLLDGSGMVMGNWPLPQPGAGMSVVLNAVDTSGFSGADLFVGISLDVADGGGLTADSQFVLTMSVEDGPVSSSVRPDNTTPISSLPWWSFSPDGRSGNQPSSQISSIADSVALSPGQDGVGPLPMRTVGPSAGVLADGQTIPPIDPLDGPVIDLTLIDVSSEPLLPLPKEPQGIEGLATIRSPGGFPLLVSAGPTKLHAASAALFVTRATPAAREQTSPLQRPKPITDRSGSEESRERRSPIAITLSVAIAISFGLLLPDFIIKLTPASPKRPLPWAFRKRQPTRS